MSRYPHFPGVGDRIRERLIQLGFVKDGKADAARFIREKRYDGRYFYAWLAGRTPTGGYLTRLCEDLDTPQGWLLLGDDGIVPPGNRPRRRGRALAGLLLAASVMYHGLDASQGEYRPTVDKCLSYCALSEAARRLLRRLTAAIVPGGLHHSWAAA